MRIGIIKHRYVAEGGGSERYINGLVGGLLQRGHEVQVFARLAQRGSSSITVHRVPVLGGPSFVRQWSFARSCKRTVQRTRCDLVFSGERTIWQDVARAGGGCHREYLAQCQRYLGKGLSLRLNLLHATLLRLERQTFSQACTQRLIANSHRGKEEIVRHYGFPADGIEVIHNGTDLERFRPRPRPGSNVVVLLFVGSDFERKGLPWAIRALARLPQNVELRVAGKGNRAAGERLAHTLGVASRLHFLGVQRRMEDVYSQGDILVHPAIYEPFSNACLEAMACGLPVVTTRINGASEIIDGENGAVVEQPNDVDALAAAIGDFCNAKKRGAARESARQTAEKLPLALNVERTLAVLQRLA